MATTPLMKDGLGREAVQRVAASFSRVWPAFPAADFQRESLRGLEALELKQRVQHIGQALARHLPASFPEQAALLRRLPDAWHPGDEGDPLRGFAAWPVIDLVSVTGLDHPGLALDTLKAITHLFSAEFAIRPFLDRDWDACLPRLTAWTRDPSEHVRRLVSEGTRPRLPWGLRLRERVRDPRPSLPLLVALRDDPSAYVRRSVANHLNDIGKDHPELALDLFAQWSEDAGEERQALIRHAARSLIKSGHPKALALLGAGRPARVEVETFALRDARVDLGAAQQVNLVLRSTAASSQRLVVDLVVHHRKADGGLRPKVFKGWVFDLGPGESRSLERALPFRPLTTRTYYGGEHRIEAQVNGRTLAGASFELRVPRDAAGRRARA